MVDPILDWFLRLLEQLWTGVQPILGPIVVLAVFLYAVSTILGSSDDKGEKK